MTAPSVAKPCVDREEVGSANAIHLLRKTVRSCLVRVSPDFRAGVRLTHLGCELWRCGHKGSVTERDISEVSQALDALAKSVDQACRPVVFSGKLPSMEAEIDCKLQPNPR